MSKVKQTEMDCELLREAKQSESPTQERDSRVEDDEIEIN